MPEPDKQVRAQEAIQNPTSVIRELCDREFYFFLQHFWKTIYSHYKFKPNWHIKYLCDVLQEKAERVANSLPNNGDLVINIPPGTTKSTICSVMFPVWCWTRWYWMRFLTFSYNQDISLKPADLSKKLLQSSKFNNIYPELKLTKDAVSMLEISKMNEKGEMEFGGYRFSSSVGGTGTGLHGDINVVDDPLNPKQQASVADLKFVNDWFDETLPTRKTDKEVTLTLLIMQRLGQGDPSGRLLEKKAANIKHICLPGDISDPGYAKLVRPQELKENYVNGLLDPVRLSRKVLNGMIEDLGQFNYASQFGQNPVPPEGRMFKPDNFQIIDALPPTVSIIKTVRYWDKAGTKDGTGAYTVGTKMCILANGKFIVIDVVRGRWSSDIREKIIRSTAEADGTGVEVWHEQEPGSGGKESAEATTRNLAGFMVSPDRPTGDKVRRADPWSVQVNAGNAMLLRGEWNREYKEEHRYFPVGNYKDQVDSSSGAFAKLAVKKQVQVW